MNDCLVLSCDIGTQSLRAALVAPDGGILDIEQIKYEEPYFSTHPGWAEVKTDMYYDCLKKASSALCSRNQDRLCAVIGVVLTCIRDTLVFLDEDYKPTRDILHWLDSREADFDNALPWWKTAVFAAAGVSGMTEAAYRTSKVNWIKQKQPEIWERTKKVVCLPAYLNFRLTGRLADSVANTIAHIPLDNRKKQWKGEHDLIRCLYDVPNEKLYELTPSGVVLGNITREASLLTGIPEGLPLIATGSDKGCETLGLSVSAEDKAAISFGTTATIQFSSRKYFEPQPNLPSYPAVENDKWNPEIEIFRGFWLLRWFIKEFGQQDAQEAEKLGISPEALLNERAAKIPAGCEGLMLQPYWTPGVLQPDSMGTVIGWRDSHTRYHLYRAIIEGICLELYMAKEIMEKRSGMRIRTLYVGGGGARSELACRICADVFGLPVKRIQTHEASVIGSAMVAFVSRGIFADYEEAAAAMSHERETIEPDENTHQYYMKLYKQVYSGIFPRMAPLYKRLNKLKKAY